MRRSQQAFSAPSKQTQSSNAKDELSSTASINASSTTLIPSSELLASKPRDSTLKREQNSCYEHDNGLDADSAATNFRFRTATSKRGTTDKAHTSATNIAPPRKAVIIDAKARLALVLPCEICRQFMAGR